MKVKTFCVIAAVIGVFCSLFTTSAFADVKSVTMTCSGYTGTTTLTDFTWNTAGDSFVWVKIPTLTPASAGFARITMRSVSSQTPIISWNPTSKPSGIDTVKFVSATEERKRTFVTKDDGLYVLNGFLLIVR